MDDVVVDSAYDQTGKLLSKGNLSYTYDELDRLTCVQQDGATAETYTYDKLGRMSSKTVDDNTYFYAYKDNISSKLQSLTLPNGTVMQPLTDVNGRNTGKEVLVDGDKVLSEHISYRKVGDHATNQPVAIYFGDKQSGTYAIKGNLKYKYDEMGNVTHVFQDGILVCTYTYDKLSRLIREDNKKLGKTYLYSYDNCGNMLSKRIANYTTKPAEEIEFSEETLYSHVGDRLFSVNGQALSYDNYGRLLNYNGKALSWQSNRLASVDDVAITYDVFGRRTSKGETTFTYDSNNNILTAGDLSFFYDTHGIAGFTYEGETYYYRKNIQGDVIALLTADGTVVATYTYDAWGNCVVATDTNGIGETNPIRYRSYYWDDEFGLYFLKSRYYSPTLCRFISQDSIEYLDPESINGLNLYAYCYNNPIMYVDPSGHSPWWSWALSGLQLVAGVALCFVPGMQGLGASLAIGGATGLIMNALEPQLAQAIGGVGSMANGYGAISTGISLMGLGGWSILAGLGLIVIGAGTMAFGANEVVDAVTGTNYIQKWMGMSDSAYAWSYLGLNFASSVGQAAGNMYHLHATRQVRFSNNGVNVKGYRYFDRKCNPFFDFDYPHGKIKYNHWHGWYGPGLTNRSKGEHWSYLELIWWMFGGM